MTGWGKDLCWVLTFQLFDEGGIDVGISDLPALVILSRWSTKGKLSCLVCMKGVKAKQLGYRGKVTFYDTSRYFLKPDDPLGRSIKFESVETRSCTCRHSDLIAKIMCEQIQFPPPKSHPRVK